MKLFRTIRRAWTRFLASAEVLVIHAVSLIFKIKDRLLNEFPSNERIYRDRVQPAEREALQNIIGWAARHEQESRDARTVAEIRAAAHQIRTKPLNFEPPKGERNVIGVPKHELTGRDMMQQWDYLKYKALQAGAKTGDEIWVTEAVEQPNEVIVYWYEKSS